MESKMDNVINNEQAEVIQYVHVGAETVFPKIIGKFGMN